MKLGEIAYLMAQIELKTLENELCGRSFVQFGTVKPRVQIPGSRPVFPANGSHSVFAVPLAA